MVLAHRDAPVAAIAPWIGAASITPSADAGEHHEHRAHAVADLAPTHQQVHGAEREPRDVEDGAEEIERPERAPVPAGRGAGRERRRGQREERERDRPGALMGRRDRDQRTAVAWANTVAIAVAMKARPATMGAAERTPGTGPTLRKAVATL